MAEKLHPRDLKRILLRTLCWLWQMTWGLPQTLLGALLFACCAGRAHTLRCGAAVTRWQREAGLSLGLFVFLPTGERGDSLLSHELGHTAQSFLLGPLYLPLVGLPSLIWAALPEKQRKMNYFDFYTEKWANRLGKTFKI